MVRGRLVGSLLLLYRGFFFFFVQNDYIDLHKKTRYSSTNVRQVSIRRKPEVTLLFLALKEQGLFFKVMVDILKRYYLLEIHEYEKYKENNRNNCKKSLLCSFASLFIRKAVKTHPLSLKRLTDKKGFSKKEN